MLQFAMNPLLSAPVAFTPEIHFSARRSDPFSLRRSPTQARFLGSTRGRRFSVRRFVAVKTLPDYALRIFCLTSDVEALNERARQLAENAAELYSRGDLSGALMTFTEAIELKPRDVYILYLNRAAVFAAFQQFKSALKDVDSAIRDDPNFALAHVYAGDFNFELKNYDAAYFSYRDAESLDPESKEIKERIEALARFFPEGFPSDVDKSGGFASMPDEYKDLLKDLNMSDVDKSSALASIPDEYKELLSDLNM